MSCLEYQEITQKETCTLTKDVRIKHAILTKKAMRLNYVRKICVTINNAPLFTWLRLLMLAILIEILTEIPLQKQHIMRQLKTQNTKEIQCMKDNTKDCKLLTK